MLLRSYALLMLLVCLCTPLQARLLAVNEIPAPLKEWVDWVLYDTNERHCPYRYNGQAQACRWPSRLQLELDQQGGRFTQQWQVFSATRVRLPGDSNNWPQRVRLLETRRPAQAEQSQQALNLPEDGWLVVEEQDGLPYVRLPRGIHTLSGKFDWQSLPRSLRVPPESGLVTLQLNGQTLQQPDLNAAGQLWLRESSNQTASEDNVDIQVFRHIQDGHPITVETQIRLRVSGKQRNATLAPVLLPDMIPLALDSPLPARLDPQQQLQVQLRPGEWTLTVTGRAPNDRSTFTLPSSNAPWPPEEVWVFAADSDMRQVDISGVNSIDPNQTNLPSGWHHLPAYLLSAEQSFQLDVVQRGAADTAKSQLTLKRTLWLDFAGEGYTLHDDLSGYIGPQNRLDALPTLELGRVSLDGEPQFITRQTADSPAGVELRTAQLRLEAESRYTGPIQSPPVNGWQQDLQRVNTTLYLPSGWRLFFASGTDNQPNSWLHNWSLLDLFLVLVIAIGTGYLFGSVWGGFALITLMFIWPESGAPKFIWLNLLAVIALLRVVPESGLKRFLNGYRWLSLLVLVLIALPYLINTVRVSLYPQLDGGHYVQSTPPSTASRSNTAAMHDELSAESAPMAEQTQNYARKAQSEARRPTKQAQAKLQKIDPNSQIQTGPGLPHWQNYRAISLRWAGPVKPDERSRLWFLPPKLNLGLQLLGLLFMLGLAWRLSHDRRHTPPTNKQHKQQGWLARLSLRLLPLGLVLACLVPPNTLQAAELSDSTLPSPTLLDTLQQRLTAPPDCLPQCAQIARMHVELEVEQMQLRLEVHASSATSVPLPGSQATWLAEQVWLNGSAATGLQRDDAQQLWLSLPAGIHTIQLRGQLPPRNSIPLPLPLRPHQVTWQAHADSRWRLAGVMDNGRPESQLQLNRTVAEDQQARLNEPLQLPVFVKVERQLQLGLDWQVETAVTRQAPLDTPLSITLPLLPNEEPMSEQLSIQQRHIKVSFGANQQQVSWTSRLKKTEQLTLEAAKTSAYLERWTLLASPIWHVEASGLPVNRYEEMAQSTLPVWQPWPGEQLILNINRPAGMPGQTITVRSSELAIAAGARANDVELTLDMLSSRGVQHAITLPEGASLQSFSIDGVSQRIQSASRQLDLRLKPGEQRIKLAWRDSDPARLSYRFPAVGVGLPSVNSNLSFRPPPDRWILWTSGPVLGPAVLFWGVLLALLVVALLLGYSRFTPLKSWQWLLLGIGLSQTHPLLMVVVAGWLLALALRAKYDATQFPLNWWQFNGIQLLLVVLTVVALGILSLALSMGLLGKPEMQIAGFGSSAYELNWYQDRSDATLPQPLVMSAPMWLYRVLMLAWALWLAIAVLGWLRWGWQALNVGGLWKKRPARVKKSERTGTTNTQHSQIPN